MSALYRSANRDGRIKIKGLFSYEQQGGHAATLHIVENYSSLREQLNGDITSYNIILSILIYFDGHYLLTSIKIVPL